MVFIIIVGAPVARAGTAWVASEDVQYLTRTGPEEIRPLLSALGTDLDLTRGPVGLSFTVDTPMGPVTFH